MRFIILPILIFMQMTLSAAEKAKIILIAGKDSHKAGDHEFIAGCTLFKKQLEAAMGDQLEIVLITEKWPEDESVFEGAKATVIYSDGLRKHPLNQHFEKMDKFVDQGMGFAVMHFACDVKPGEHGDYFKKWIGGHYETGFSRNPHWVCDSIYNKEHPVTRGCKNFSLKDEWYFNIRFNDPENHQYVLKGKPGDKLRRAKYRTIHAGREETLMWTLERTDGGRGFGFTGGHVHKNWQNDDLRKLIYNGIIWLAKIDVPSNGVETPTPTDEEMYYMTSGYRKQLRQNKKPSPQKEVKSVQGHQCPGCNASHESNEQDNDCSNDNASEVRRVAKKNAPKAKAKKAPPVGSKDTLLPVEFLQTMDDLEITVWATSPMFYNPTNMDIDAKGRIWIAEGINYRKFKNKATPKAENGDRIMVLEDTNGDGKADKSHMFVEDKQLTAPLGVAVVGNKVIVSQPPSILVYTDVNGDAKFDPEIDTKEEFLTGFSGLDHDHSLHSVTVGPDGEYYFNQGNAGASIVKDKSGFTVRAGSWYKGGSPTVKSNQPGLVSDDGFIYVGGFACRIKPDGTGLTVIGHNFRNSYEQTVSSFGDVFQNDNDDPPACRTTWLMEYGNLGFSSNDGKRRWIADQRPGQSRAIAEWRQEDPGMIPAGDVYGSGAPTGIVLYENGALGEKYPGLLLSAESVRSSILGYFPKPQGAGFELDRFDFVKSVGNHSKRKWFRPADVAVGPDGAVYIADWFDPGSGGHKTGDRSRSGTIYRVAPKGFKPKVPTLDLKSIDGMIEALKNPAVNVRALGFYALKKQKEKAIPALKELLKDQNPYIAARAVWLLSQAGDQGCEEVEKLLADEDPQKRIVAYRALRREGWKFLEISKKLAMDPSSAVRREVALAMRNENYNDSHEILLAIAEQYDGEDRWYLEALGTGCTRKEKKMYDLIRRKLGAPALKWDKRFADIAWRLHPDDSLADMRTRALSSEISPSERKRTLTAIAYINNEAAANTMLEIALTGPEDMRSLAAWWIKNKHSGDWKEYGLDSKLKTKEVPKAVFDLDKHLTETNGNLPSIKKMLEMKGDAANGEKLFHGKAICASCHQIGDRGTEIGPILTGMAKRFDESHMLDSMINPDSAITFGYESVMVKTKDGKTINGFIVSDDDPLIIKDLAGNKTVLDLKDVAERKVQEKSLMPSVKNLGLSAQDIVDILEYLKQN